MKRYPGVSPFTAEQSNVFFGREDNIDKLQKLISLRKQVLLYSKSGIGKTSLLNAGVLPKLEEKFTILKIRFFAYNQLDKQNPLESIFEAIRTSIPDFNDLPKTILDKLVNNIDIQKSLWFQFKKIQLAKPSKFILVFDQFEELFSYPAEQIESFKNQIHELIDIDVPDSIMELIANKPEIEEDPQIDNLYEKLDVKTVFAIRSDRLNLLNSLTDKIPEIQKTFYELTSLDAEQAKNAIIGPAENDTNEQFDTKPFIYENNAIDAIIKALSNNGKQAIESTQLQIICQRIEAIAKQKQIETLSECFVKITDGDLPEFKNIFLDFYDRSVDETNEPDNTRKFVEDQLIRNNQRISLDSIICRDYVKLQTLQTLVNTHLIRAERNSTGGFSYELSHDSLIEPIQYSAKTRHDKEEEERAQAEQNEQLRIANEKALNERTERLKEKKRQRKIIVIVTTAAIISFIFAVGAFVNLSRAKKAEKIAENKTAEARKAIREIHINTVKEKMRDAEAALVFNDYTGALIRLQYADSICDANKLGELQKDVHSKIKDCKKKIK